MASRITRIIREAAEATTIAGRQVVGKRMNSLTGRVRDLADRLRDGKAGRMVGHLMDRLRGEDEARPSRSRRRTGPGTSQAKASRGGKAATAAGSRSARSGSKSAAAPHGKSAASSHERAAAPAGERSGGSTTPTSRSSSSRAGRDEPAHRDTSRSSRTASKTGSSARSRATSTDTGRSSGSRSKKEGGTTTGSRTSH